MDMNRLTQKSQEALHDAQTKALRFGHTEVDGEHLLLALLDQPDGLGRRRCSPGRAPTRTGCARTWRPSSAAARGSAGPASTPGQVYVTQRLVAAARRRRPRGQAAQGRVRLGRAPLLALLDEGSGSAAGRLLHAAGPHPRRLPGRR